MDNSTENLHVETADSDVSAPQLAESPDTRVRNEGADATKEAPVVTAKTVVTPKSMSFAERLIWSLDYAKKTRAQLARRLGVSTSAVSSWTKGRVSAISAEHSHQAAAFLGVSTSWLASGDGNPTSIEKNAPFEVLSEQVPGISFSLVDEYELSPSAPDEDGVICYVLARSSDSIPAVISSADVAQAGAHLDACKILRVQDDYMKPLLGRGDRVVLDTKCGNIVSGSVYAFSFKGSIFIRRLDLKFSGGVVISADSSQRSDEMTADQWDSDVRILGRVIMRMSSNLSKL